MGTYDQENKLLKDILDFHEGIASLEQTRDLAIEIGEQRRVSDAPILLQLLQHNDEIVRYHAVMSLGFNLKFEPATDAFIGILKQDSDADCRDAAAGALSVIWRNTKNQRIIEVLSAAALNDGDEDVRKAAYFALVVVNGISDEAYLDLLQHDRRPVDSERIASILASLPQP